MTEEMARTIAKFTNLLDMKVLPYVSVKDIVTYYQNLIDNKKTPGIGSVEEHDNITRNFQEDAFDDVAQDYDAEQSMHWNL